MATLSDILRTLQTSISAGLNAAGLTTPGETIIGWPTGSQASQIWGQGNYIISIFPLRTQNHTRYRAEPYYITPPAPPTLTATVTTGTTFSTIALSGANQAGLNLHTVFGYKAQGVDFLYQTSGMETLPQLASIIAAGVNAKGVSFVTASATGANIRVNGKWPVYCNIGNTTNLVAEVARFQREIMVTIWAPAPDVFGAPATLATREAIEDVLKLVIGGRDQAWLFAPDGSAFSALWSSTGDWEDVAESSYTVFKSTNFLTIEYPLLRPVLATLIGAVQGTQQIAAAPATTSYFGGPT